MESLNANCRAWRGFYPGFLVLVSNGPGLKDPVGREKSHLPSLSALIGFRLQHYIASSGDHLSKATGNWNEFSGGLPGG